MRSVGVDISLKTVHSAKVKLWPLKAIKVVAEWPFPQNGTERICIALLKLGFCVLKRVLKSFIGRNWLREVVAVII